MEHSRKALCVAAALAVALTASVAHAAKPVSKERQAAIAKITKNQRNFKQPKTMAEAARTEVVQADGTAGLAVPEELWNEMSAQVDAQGNVQINEADGTAAGATREVLANE